jgi:hypothetical protein
VASPFHVELGGLGTSKAKQELGNMAEQELGNIGTRAVQHRNSSCATSKQELGSIGTEALDNIRRKDKAWRQGKKADRCKLPSDGRSVQTAK